MILQCLQMRTRSRHLSLQGNAEQLSRIWRGATDASKRLPVVGLVTPLMTVMKKQQLPQRQAVRGAAWRSLRHHKTPLGENLNGRKRKCLKIGTIFKGSSFRRMRTSNFGCKKRSN